MSAIFEMLLEAVFYAIGRLLIPVLSLGRARVETLKEFSRRRPPVNYERRNGVLIVSDAIATFVGILFVACVALIVYLVLR